MSIYVVSHKPIELLDKLPTGYIPFYVGPNREALAQTGGLADGHNANIANLNASFCELTALYWIWKNDKTPYKGIVHYRRFFAEPDDEQTIVSCALIEKILANYDIVVPRKYWLLNTVQNHYKSHHNISDLKALEDVIRKQTPDYIDTFEHCIQLRYTYPYNMFVAPSALFDEYCAWLFALLFELKTHIDEEERDSYQNRVYGFLAERMMNVYITQHSLASVELPVILTERNFKRDISMKLARFLYGK